MSRKSWNSKKIPRSFQENLKNIEKNLKTNQREFQKKSKELPRKFQENSKKQLLTRNNDSHKSHESHEIHETIDNPKQWQSWKSWKLWKIWQWKLWKPWKSWNYSCVTGVVMTTYSLMCLCAHLFGNVSFLLSDPWPTGDRCGDYHIGAYVVITTLMWK